MVQVDEAAVRQRLLSEREALEHDIYERTQGTEAVTPVDPVLDSGGVASHEADDADAVTDYNRNQALIAHSRAMLQEVNSALQRLDAGTYGKCVRCGRDINPRRLEALPYVTLCIDCQEAVEREAQERRG